MRQFGLNEQMGAVQFDALNKDQIIRDFLNQSEDGIVCCRSGFKIVFCNAAFKNLFRSQHRDIGEGTSLQSVFSTAVECGEIISPTREIDEWFAALESGRAEALLRFRSGNWIRLVATTTLPQGIVATLCDVSSFKKREAWLTELHDRLAGEGEDLKHFARHLALARAEVTVALNQAEQANAALQKEIRERRALERELRKLANTDELTGALNRRRFMELTLQENTRARRQSDPLTILMMDLDHFKSINDLYGHEAGDEVLRQFSKVCRSLFRDGDLFARLGGEEFAALLPETGIKTAQLQGERVRSATELLQVYHDGEVIAVTVSVGIATIEEQDKAPLALIGRADRALYHAKHEGRNRVSVYDAHENDEAQLVS